MAINLNDPSILDPRTYYSGSDVNLPQEIIAIAINGFLLPGIGIAAVLSLVYGGVVYITAGGDAEKANKGKSVIIYSVVAIIIAALAWAIYHTILVNVNRDIVSDPDKPAGIEQYELPQT